MFLLTLLFSFCLLLRNLILNDFVNRGLVAVVIIVVVVVVFAVTVTIVDVDVIVFVVMPFLFAIYIAS